MRVTWTFSVLHFSYFLLLVPLSVGLVAVSVRVFVLVCMFCQSDCVQLCFLPSPADVSHLCFSSSTPCQFICLQKTIVSFSFSSVLLYSLFLTFCMYHFVDISLWYLWWMDINFDQINDWRLWYFKQLMCQMQQADIMTDLALALSNRRKTVPHFCFCFVHSEDVKLISH